MLNGVEWSGKIRRGSCTEPLGDNLTSVGSSFGRMEGRQARLLRHEREGSGGGEYRGSFFKNYV